MMATLNILLSLSLLTTSVLAIGDFPCSGTSDSQSCAAWAVDPARQGNISTTAKCQPDPLNPRVSYCGYARAGCRRDSDCDYGTCGKGGTCQGYLGDPCPNGNADCQAFFFCGTDGMCGGAGGACANGDPAYPIPSPNLQCMSQRCDSQKCQAVRRSGMGLGSACVTNSICESGFCDDKALVCGCSPNKSTQCAYGTASANKKSKRSFTDECASGQTACLSSDPATGLFDCIDTQSNLENCGGCADEGQGNDCTTIEGAESVKCTRGTCLVLSCAPGMTVNAQGSACIL